MNEAEKSKQYKIKETQYLIDQYKGVISKIKTVIDKDILENEINKSDTDETQNEKKYLDKITTRRKSLDEIKLCIIEVDNLDRNLETYLETKETGGNEVKKTPKNPIKQHAKK